MKQLRALTTWPFYVWFFAAYPLLYIYARNIALVDTGDMLIMLAITLAAVTALCGVLWWLFKDVIKAAALTTLVSLTFFSYGHLYKVLDDALKNRLTISHTLAFPVAILALVVAAVLVIRSHQGIRSATVSINMVAVVLLVFPLLEIASFARTQTRLEPVELNSAAMPSFQTGTHPDIYYIILDAYARGDWLEDQYGYDNTEFLDALAERGFYVASKSCSNYTRTLLSIPSALGMQYIDADGLENLGRSEGFLYASRFLKKNDRVGKALLAQGYTYFYFASGFEVTHTGLKEATRIDFGPAGAFESERNDSPYFQNVLLPTTLYLPFYKHQDRDSSDSYSWTSPDRVLLQLDELKQIASLDQPTFTFAHIIKPHYPYIFSRDGNILPKPAGWVPDDDLNSDEADDLYIEQVMFINQQILDVVDDIITNADTPPIIILQSDHAWNAENQPPPRPQRVPILNAYLVPDDMTAQLYPTISPVNSFRLLFDTYFGTDMGLLEDVSYTSPLKNPLRIRPIDDDTNREWCEVTPDS